MGGRLVYILGEFLDVLGVVLCCVNTRAFLSLIDVKQILFSAKETGL